MQFTPAIAAIVIAYTSGVSAHMLMTNPVSFAGTIQAPITLETGADFPCGPHGGVATMNNWTAGSQQNIKVIGGATHSGGSCQFSFSTDAVPTKSSKWKVIHSIIGGCPNDKGGNTSGDPADPSIPVMAVTIPKDIPNGQLTFAWTWFNKSGNREMYMKCAPVTITGGAASADALNKLPDMFVANAPQSVCKTDENVDVVFPNPGASVVYKGAGPKGTPGFKGAGCPTKDAGGAGQTAPGPTTPVDPAPVDPAPVVPAPVVPAPVVPAPVVPAPVDPAPVAPAPVAPVSNGSACPTDGALVCISATMFGICNHGAAIPQAVAAGTTCVNGAIQRRAVHHPRRHAGSLVRRHGSAFRA